MKQLSFLILITVLLFCSCNKNEPDLEIQLPINSVFVPASIEINKNDLSEEERAEIMNLVNNQHIVNDISELPNDPIGQNEAFYNLNFQNQTLLITYHFKSWPIYTYSNLFYRNTEENSYNWVIKLGTMVNDDNDTETVQLTRFAIVVKKLPVDAILQTWYSVSELGPF